MVYNPDTKTLLMVDAGDIVTTTTSEGIGISGPKGLLDRVELLRKLHLELYKQLEGLIMEKSEDVGTLMLPIENDFQRFRIGSEEKLFELADAGIRFCGGASIFYISKEKVPESVTRLQAQVIRISKIILDELNR